MIMTTRWSRLITSSITFSFTRSVRNILLHQDSQLRRFYVIL
jgi:hypothetical protein